MPPQRRFVRESERQQVLRAVNAYCSACDMPRARFWHLAANSKDKHNDVNLTHKTAERAREFMTAYPHGERRMGAAQSRLPLQSKIKAENIGQLQRVARDTCFACGARADACRCGHYMVESRA